MSNSKTKPDTPRDPVREVFGEQALLTYSEQELCAGLAKLRDMQEQADAQIVAIRKGTVDGIIAGKPGAIDSMLQPDAEMEQAQRWRLAIGAAIEAAEMAEEQVRRREQDAQLAVRRKNLIEVLDTRKEAGARLETAIEAVVAAFLELDRLGCNVLKIIGLTNRDTPYLLRFQHIKHMAELELHCRSEGLWEYDRVPLAGGHFHIQPAVAAIAADLIRQFEAATEKQMGRPVDWDTVPEEAGAGA